jgi:hypothetical protein
LYQHGEWADFVDRAFGKTYYVQCTSGSDTTGDGTSSYPFQTIKKAVDSIEDGGFGSVILYEAGNYQIDDYITLINKFVRIVRVSGKASNVIFESYLDATDENNLYKIVLRNSVILLAPTSIQIDAPANVAKNWNNSTAGGFGVDAFAGAIYSSEGNNYALVSTTGGTSFSATAGASGFPCLFYQEITSLLSITAEGDFTTNDNGYILGYVSGSTPITMVSNSSYTIDNYLYSVLNGSSVSTITITTGTMPALSGNFRISIDEASTSYTNNLTDDDSEADIEAEVEALFLRNTGLTVTAIANCTYDGSSKITSITLRISGLQSKSLSFPLSVIDGSLTYNRYFYDVSYAHIISN